MSRSERRTKLRDFPHDAHGARGGLKEAEEGIHGGGFACAVLTDQSEEIALADFEIEAVKGVDFVCAASRAGSARGHFRRRSHAPMPEAFVEAGHDFGVRFFAEIFGG